MTLGFVSMINVVSVSFAEYYHVRDEKRLDRAIDKYDLVVVLFYNKKMAHESVKQLFKQLSRGYSYHQAEVAFIGIDVAQEDGAAIARAYGVKKTPALVLFEDGRLVIGKDNVPVVATDIRSTSDMRIVINTYFGDRIQDVLREREERIRCGRSRRSDFRFGISYGYQYYPYYGYPFGYQYGYPIIYW
jgi:hypothetical protein